MKYQTLPAAARRAGISTSWLRKLLYRGEVAGAVKLGRDWLIPTSWTAPDVPSGYWGHRKNRGGGFPPQPSDQ